MKNMLLNARMEVDRIISLPKHSEQRALEKAKSIMTIKELKKLEKTRALTD